MDLLGDGLEPISQVFTGPGHRFPGRGGLLPVLTGTPRRLPVR